MRESVARERHGVASRMIAPGRVAVAASTAVILALTLMPVPGGESRLVMLGLGAPRSVADALANVLLFMPFGAAAAVRLRGWWPVAAAAGLSLFIEVAQLGIAGRYTSPFDVVFNTLGGVAGLALVRGSKYWLMPDRRVAVLLAGAWLIPALAVLAGGGLLFRPSVTEPALYGQWTADFGDMETYDGRVITARVGGLEVPSRRVAESAALKELLLTGAPIRVTAVAGGPPAGLAPLFSIFDAGAVEVLLIGIDGADLVFRYRMRAMRWRLDEPHFRAYGALSNIGVGDEFEVEITRQGAETCLRISDPGGSRESCEFGYTVGDTWALLLFPLPRPLPALMRVLWVAALLAPVGFWLRRWPMAAGAGALAVVVLAAAPGVTGMLPTPVSQLAAAAGGIAAGYWIARWLQARTDAGTAILCGPQRKPGDTGKAGRR
jgi:hypothetical protein